MKEHHIIYKVKSGDTLKSISSRLGMNETELKTFHNLHCGKLNRIWFNNLLAIDYVVLPTNYEPSESIEKRKETEKPKTISASFFHPKYLVEEIFEKPETEDLKIQYHLTLEFNENSVAHVNREKLTSNGKTPDNKMSDVSLQCMKSVSPLPFLFNSEGKIIGFKNHPEMVEKFKNKRKELEQFFVGEIYSQYFQRFEENISNETFFLNQLKSTLLYQVLFPNLKWFHQKKSWQENFHIIQNSFPANFDFNADYHHENEDFVQTTIEAFFHENTSLHELLKGIRNQENADEPAKGKLDLKYKTHKIQHQLESAEACISLFHEESLYQKQSLTITKIP